MSIEKNGFEREMNMKRFVLLISTVLLVIMFSACSQDVATSAASSPAESDDLQQETADGIVEAVNVYQIIAPYAGTLNHFDWKDGDNVKKGDVLFTLDTNKVYAPCDGTIGSARALPGDSVKAVQARYGALCYIEPENPLIVSASTNGAYNSKANKFINIGENLFIKKTNGKAPGSGNVITVSGSSYSVEVDAGSYKVGDSVRLYRKDNYSSKSKVGTGTVSRINPVAVAAQSSDTVFKVYAEQNKQVHRGDLLYETIQGNFGTLPANNEIRSEYNGVIGEVSVSTGQSVRQNQVLASVYDITALRINASVDGKDIGKISVGNKVAIIFDNLPDKSYQGSVEFVSGIGEKKQDASYYEVKIAFTPDEAIKLGMSATVYLP
jgi:multidrug resistance efflux pump